MTLKEIKKWREGNTYIHTTELAPMFDWLIAEVEMLHRDRMTIYAMMEDGRAKAKRCAEIADKLPDGYSGSQRDGASIAAIEIRKEFNL